MTTPGTSLGAAAPATRPRSAALLAGLGLGSVLVVVHLLQPDGPVGHLSYLAVNLGATVAAWLGTRRLGYRRAAVLLSIGVTLAAVGDTMDQWLWSGPAAPRVSAADIAWLGSYGCLLAGLHHLLRTGHRRLGAAGWADVGTLCGVCLALQWPLGLGAILEGATPLGVRLVWLAYPVLDAVLLALVARIALDGRVRGPAGLLLVVGAILWLVPEGTPSGVGDSSALGAVLHGGWLGGSIALAAAIWLAQDPRTTGRPAPEALERVGAGQITVGLGVLLVPSAAEMGAHLAGTDADPVPLFVLTASLVTMLLIRSVALVRQSRTDRAQLQAERRRASRLAEASSDAIAIVGRDGRLLNEGSEVAELVGEEGPARGADVFAWVHPLDLAAARRLFERSLDRPGIAVEGELRAPHGDDGLIWLGVRSTNLLDDPDVRGIVVSFHDITDRKLAEAELEHLAFHDSLTGLPNRALFSDRVGHALDWASTRGEAAAVLLLDLDGFKVVNDSLGHAAGDELLQVAAARLADAVGLDGSIARLGGDELAVLVGPVHGAMAIAQGVAERVQCALADPVELEGRLVTMSASIGIAGSDGQTDVGGLLRDADVALYQAKAAGKAQWVVFRPPMRAAAVERLQLETDLPLALERHELALAYQPVVDLASGRVAGFEALLRWHHPVLGLVGPDRFIALAEETGHIVPIGAWVLEEACRTAAQWQRLQPTAPPLTMAVNVSARQLASDDLVTCVASALRESGLDPRTLVLEVTETSLVTDPGAAARRLQPLRELGVRVAIDDFGTGHSSLSYLRQLPVDILKIDRSFVRNLADAGTGPALVQTLIDLGRTLDLEVIAEGVEDAGQRDWLRAQRCHQAQGYLFARPLARDDAELLLLGLPGESPVLAPAEVRPG